MLRTIIPVYHADSKKRNDDFIENKTPLLVSVEDGYWCGSGMYFWDNMSNALYWLDHVKKSRKVYSSICLARLQYSKEECLDLTDEAEAKQLIKYANAFLDKMSPSERPNLDKRKPGAIVNFVFNSMKAAGMPTFKVVKLSGLYGSKSNSIFNEWFKGPHATLRSKTIYSVRNPELLSKKMEVKNDGI